MLVTSLNRNQQIPAHQLIGQPPLNEMNAPIASQSNVETKNKLTRPKKNIRTSGVKLAEINSSSKVLPKKQFRCANCSYIAKRKYTLKVHMKQHCTGINVPKEMIKDKTCRICQKMFTHDGLRSHLRGFIKDTSRKIRGIHKNFDVDYHKIYLDEIKYRP